MARCPRPSSAIWGRSDEVGLLNPHLQLQLTNAHAQAASASRLRYPTPVPPKVKLPGSCAARARACKTTFLSLTGASHGYYQPGRTGPQALQLIINGRIVRWVLGALDVPDEHRTRRPASAARWRCKGPRLGTLGVSTATMSWMTWGRCGLFGSACAGAARWGANATHSSGPIVCVQVSQTV